MIAGMEKTIRNSRRTPMNNRPLLLLCLAFCLVFAGTQSSWAQSISYGKLTGQATDSEGQALPGVLVEITSGALISGSRTTTTSTTGSYVFLNLPVGTYNLSATLEGFTTMLRSGIRVSAGETISI